MLEWDKRAYADAALEAVGAAIDGYLKPSSKAGWRNELARTFAALEEVSKAVGEYRARVGSGITPGAVVTASGAGVRAREDSDEDQRKVCVWRALCCTCNFSACFCVWVWARVA
jgi:hypothetical protein